MAVVFIIFIFFCWFEKMALVIVNYRWRCGWWCDQRRINDSNELKLTSVFGFECGWTTKNEKTKKRKMIMCYGKWITACSYIDHNEWRQMGQDEKKRQVTRWCSSFVLNEDERQTKKWRVRIKIIMSYGKSIKTKTKT